MNAADEITVSRHAAQKIMHWALTAAPLTCRGLLAGHGHRIDDAVMLAGGRDGRIEPSEVRDATERLRDQGMAVVGWFHSRADAHEPDAAAMAALETLSAASVHLLAALDMKGRLDLHAYVQNRRSEPLRAPLRLLDDTPLYLDAARR